MCIPVAMPHRRLSGLILLAANGRRYLVVSGIIVHLVHRCVLCLCLCVCLPHTRLSINMSMVLSTILCCCVMLVGIDLCIVRMQLFVSVSLYTIIVCLYTCVHVYLFPLNVYTCFSTILLCVKQYVVRHVQFIGHIRDFYLYQCVVDLISTSLLNKFHRFTEARFGNVKF